jgi:hypothetical protein
MFLLHGFAALYVMKYLLKIPSKAKVKDAWSNTFTPPSWHGG